MKGRELLVPKTKLYKGRSIRRIEGKRVLQHRDRQQVAILRQRIGQTPKVVLVGKRIRRDGRLQPGALLLREGDVQPPQHVLGDDILQLERVFELDFNALPSEKIVRVHIDKLDVQPHDVGFLQEIARQYEIDVELIPGRPGIYDAALVRPDGARRANED